MTKRSCKGEEKLEAEPCTRAEAAVLEPDSTFRILLLGDFSGHGAGCGQSSTGWAPVEIGRDDFNEVLAAMRPQVGALGFQELGDFHPDRIYQRSAAFAGLRELRLRLRDPAEFAAAAEIHRWSSGEEAANSRAPLAPSGGSPRDASGEGEETERPAVTPPAADLGDFRHPAGELGAPQADFQAIAGLPRLLGMVDAETGARMRALLHDPGFRALEAAWRGVFRLVRAVAAGREVRVYLADLSKAELAAGLNSPGDGRDSLCRRLMVEQGEGEDGQGWGVVAGLYSFRPGREDAEILSRLAGVMESAGAPFLAEGGSGYGESDEDSAAWLRVRRMPEARWIGLAKPRWLLRLPYSSRTVPLESFAFEEMPPKPEHQRYLWNNPALACVQLLAESFARDGCAMRPPAGGVIGGLPLHVFEDEGAMKAQPCAELLLTDEEVEAIHNQGYMVLAAEPEQDAVRVARFHSIAAPSAPLAGRWG